MSKVTAVKARGDSERFTISKKNGTGPIRPGDVVFLRAHTWKMIDVEGTAVQARWYDEGTWQSLTIEKSRLRRLTQSSETRMLQTQVGKKPAELSTFLLV